MGHTQHTMKVACTGALVYRCLAHDHSCKIAQRKAAEQHYSSCQMCCLDTGRTVCSNSITVIGKGECPSHLAGQKLQHKIAVDPPPRVIQISVLCQHVW